VDVLRNRLRTALSQAIRDRAPWPVIRDLAVAAGMISAQLDDPTASWPHDAGDRASAYGQAALRAWDDWRERTPEHP
jgi:hypothetical protein